MILNKESIAIFFHIKAQKNEKPLPRSVKRHWSVYFSRVHTTFVTGGHRWYQSINKLYRSIFDSLVDTFHLGRYIGRTNLFKATRKYDTIDSYDRLNGYVLFVIYNNWLHSTWVKNWKPTLVITRERKLKDNSLETVAWHGWSPRSNRIKSWERNNWMIKYHFPLLNSCF